MSALQWHHVYYYYDHYIETTAYYIQRVHLIICGVIKQKESKVGNNMLLVSDLFLYFEYMWCDRVIGHYQFEVCRVFFVKPSLSFILLSENPTYGSEDTVNFV